MLVDIQSTTEEKYTSILLLVIINTSYQFAIKTATQLVSGYITSCRDQVVNWMSIAVTYPTVMLVVIDLNSRGKWIQ